MVQQAAERVAEFLLDQVGDGLRTVLVVTPDGHRISYLHEPLQLDYSPETFEKVVDTFRLEQPFFSPNIEGTPVGEREAMVHYHQHAFVLQFPYSDTETILISVTREVGRDLLGFIERCREMVHDGE